jgi:hypothetical protein
MEISTWNKLFVYEIKNMNRPNTSLIVSQFGEDDSSLQVHGTTWSYSAPQLRVRPDALLRHLRDVVRPLFEFDVQTTIDLIRHWNQMHLRHNTETGYIIYGDQPHRDANRGTKISFAREEYDRVIKNYPDSQFALDMKKTCREPNRFSIVDKVFYRYDRPYAMTENECHLIGTVFFTGVGRAHCFTQQVDDVDTYEQQTTLYLTRFRCYIANSAGQLEFKPSTIMS